MRRLLSICFVILLICPFMAVTESADDFIVSDVVEESDREYFWARMIMSDMTLEEKVAQLFIATPEMLSGEIYTLNVTESLQNKLQEIPVGGVAFFGQNIQSDEQLAQFTEDIQKIATEKHGISAMIVAEEEGGDVSRIGQKLGLDPLPGASELQSEEAAFKHGENLAARLTKYGFNMNLAPVADVLENQDNGIRNRAISGGSERTAQLAAEVMKGMQQHGVIAVMKHFPGHGSVAGNTHNGVHNILKTLEELKNSDLIPYIYGMNEGLCAIQVSTLQVKKVEKELPACFSFAVVTDLLRNEMGFEGVVITDSLRQRTITDQYSSGEAACLAIEAGCDLLYLPENFDAAYQALITAVRDGTISEERIEESVVRILMLKIKYGLIQS